MSRYSRYSLTGSLVDPLSFFGEFELPGDQNNVTRAWLALGAEASGWLDESGLLRDAGIAAKSRSVSASPSNREATLGVSSVESRRSAPIANASKSPGDLYQRAASRSRASSLRASLSMFFSLSLASIA